MKLEEGKKCEKASCSLSLGRFVMLIKHCLYLEYFLYHIDLLLLLISLSLMNRLSVGLPAAK